MKGDLVTAHFAENAARGASSDAQPPRGAAMPAPASQGTGSQRLQRIEAFGDVHISAEAEVAVGDRGVYNAETGIAVLDRQRQDHARAEPAQRRLRRGQHQHRRSAGC